MVRGLRVLIAGVAMSAAVAVAGACGGGGSPAKPAASSVSATAVAATASTASTAPAASIPPAASTSPAAPADFAAGRSTPVADDMYPQYGDPATDVLHYGLDLKWDPKTTVLTGTATLAVRAAKPTDHFVLDLASGLSADSVTVDGAPAADTHTGDRLTVPAGKTLPADATITVVIAYHGIPRLVPPPMTRRDISGLGAQVTADGAVWAQQDPYWAFTWFPCNDQPSDKALYDVAITAPDGWAGVSGGAFQGRTELGGGENVYRWHQPNPVATYLVAFAVDRFQQDTATGPHGIPLTFWYLPADAEAAHRLTAQVPAVISFLEQRFGPYPFPTAGVLFRPEMVGMETQTMITLSARVPVEDLLHEFAHQWFGDAVTPTTWSGLWLNEGFAMYAQFLWDADHPAPLSPQTTIDALMKDRALPRDQSLRTGDGPPGHYLPSHFASTNVYYCPALMLNGIRDDLGDAAFYQVLTEWVRQHQGTNQDRNAFVAFLDARTGRDFTPYVNAWLDSPTTPTIAPPGPSS